MTNTKKIKVYYALALALVASLIIFNYVLSLNADSKQKFDATIINLAGRQRMLSQKLVKEYCISHTSTQEISKVFKEDIAVWDNVHMALQQGSKSLNLPKLKAPQIEQLFIELNPIQSALKAYLNKPFSDAHFSEIQQLEAAFLVQMDKIVFAFEKRANEKRKLYLNRQIVVSIVSIVILLLEFILIVNPLFSKLIKENIRLKTINHSVSHEARMPLTNIMSLCEELQHEHSEEERKVYLQALDEESKNLDAIIRQTIKLSDKKA